MTAIVRLPADELLAEIDGYCKRTGTPQGYVGKLAFNHPGYVPLIRKRRFTSHDSAERVRAVMAERPDGISDEAILQAKLSDCRSAAGRRKVEKTLSALRDKRERMDAMPRVNRDPCFWCGATVTAGCKHRKAGDGHG